MKIWHLLQDGCLLSEQERSAAILQQKPTCFPLRSFCWRIQAVKPIIGLMNSVVAAIYAITKLRTP